MTHPKVLERYKQYNWSVDIEPTNDQNERMFLEFVKKTKQPMRKSISHMYRTKIGNEEYFYYHEEWFAHDLIGNEIMHFKPSIGKYEEPVFSFDVDSETGDIRAT